MSAGRNFLINLGGNLLGLVLFAALTPVYLHAIGEERYGVLTVILSLSMYVATFNFGMGPALTYRIAGDLRDDIAGQSEAYWSAMALSTPLGLIASILIFGLLPIGLADLMHLSVAARGELHGAILPLIGIGLCTILNANVRGVWAGRQAFLTMATTGSIDTVLAILAPVLAALYVSNSISALLYATFVARIVMLLAGMALCSFKMFGGLLPRVSLARIRSMTGYGGWVTLGTLVETLSSSADRLVLGTISGAAQIANYSIPLSITSRSMIIPLSLLSSLFPKMIGADKAQGSALLEKSLRFLLLLTPGYVFVAAVAAPVLRFWISPAFADKATWPLQLLAMAMWLDGVGALYYYQLNARGNARGNFLVATVVLVPYVAALGLGAGLLGATGVAAAYLLRSVMILGMRTWLAKIKLGALLPIALNTVPFVIVLLLAPHDWSGMRPLTLGVAIAAVLLSVAMCLWTRPHDLVEMLNAVLPARIRRAPRVSIT